MPQELTTEQEMKRFLEHVRHLVDYWDKSDRQTTKEKLSGLAFCILVVIDGESADLPPFNLVPFYGESNVDGDIAGNLHNLFYKE